MANWSSSTRMTFVFAHPFSALVTFLFQFVRLLQCRLLHTLLFSSLHTFNVLFALIDLTVVRVWSIVLTLSHIFSCIFRLINSCLQDLAVTHLAVRVINFFFTRLLDILLLLEHFPYFQSHYFFFVPLDLLGSSCSPNDDECEAFQGGSQLLFSSFSSRMTNCHAHHHLSSWELLFAFNIDSESENVADTSRNVPLLVSLLLCVSFLYKFFFIF